MNKEQDLYTALLGVKGQVERDSESVEELRKSYNRLIDSFDANGINDLSNKLHDTLESVKSFVEKYDDISELKSKIDLVDGRLIDPLKNFLDKIQPALADSIYNACDNLRDDFDLFENHIWNKLSKSEGYNIDFPSGLNSSKNLNVFLMGEFSSGKTTFIQRLLMQKAGEIAASPTTGLLVIHRVSDDESIQAKFKNKFKLNDSSSFSKFVSKYNMLDYFEQNGEIWKLRKPDDSIPLSPEFNSSAIVEFVTSANDYAEAFLEIQWSHRRRGNSAKTTLFDFADLYDMPGIGSSNVQHDDSIKHVLNFCNPDVIFYLLDSGSAIPSSDGSVLLNSMLKILPQMSHPPLFFWVYEKPAGVESDTRKVTLDEDGEAKVDDSFLNDMRKALLDYIENPHSNENFEFDNRQKEYLKDGFLLDARGAKEDSSMLENAVSLALKQYFIIRGSQILDEIKDKWNFSSRNDSLFKFINCIPNQDKYSIGYIFEEIRKSENLEDGKILFEDARKVFITKLFMEEEYGEQYPEEIKNTLDRLKSSIDKTIDDMLSNFADGLGKKTINTQKILNFPKLYDKKEDWQDLVSKVQAYHWLQLAYSGKTTSTYLLGPGSAILTKIERDIHKLESITTEIPLCGKVV